LFQFDLLIELHGVLLSPLLGQLVVLVRVSFEDPGNLGDKWIVGVGVAQQRAHAQKNLADCESRGPLRSENIQTD